MFGSAECSLLRAAGFSRSLDISKLRFLTKKKFQLYFFLSFWSSNPRIRIQIRIWIHLKCCIRIWIHRSNIEQKIHNKRKRERELKLTFSRLVMAACRSRMSSVSSLYLTTCLRSSGYFTSRDRGTSAAQTI